MISPLPNARGDWFSPDYFSARARFCSAAEAQGFELAQYGLSVTGPEGKPLTLDVARYGSRSASKVLVVSSGTHGVEGFFGSAVQLALLEQGLLGRNLPKHLAVVLVHAINPYGFAHVRRVNEANVDLNRNFLPRGRAFAGAPEAYRKLDPLLNPPSADDKLDLFWLQAGLAVAQTGFKALKNAVAQGQYEFPKGLFFGGHAATATQGLLEVHAHDWLGTPERVLHIDLHTGMGKWGRYALCTDLPSASPRVAQLGREFGAANVQAFDPGGVLYEIHGALGPWLQQQHPSTQYDCLLAEFGTYPALKMLAALRRENRAHHYGAGEPALGQVAKAQLFEAFCPRSEQWRDTALRSALNVVAQALKACA